LADSNPGSFKDLSVFEVASAGTIMGWGFHDFHGSIMGIMIFKGMYLTNGMKF
jgi:hypothetical protein